MTEAVKLVREQNLPASQVARDLGVYPETLRRWTRTNTLIGAGKRLQQTLISHADGLARHERAHLKQIERTLNVLEGTR